MSIVARMTISTNRTALITGAATRLGRSIALFLAARGYDILIHYNRSEQEAQILAEQIAQTGQRAYLLQADLKGEKEAYALFDAALQQVVHIDVLINNASIFERIAFTDTDQALLDAHMNIHVHTPFFLSQAFAKQTFTPKQHGNIINMLDTKITSNEGAYFAYLLSKKSFLALNQMLAKELAPHIRVNAICPGSILPSEHWSEEDIARKNNSLPLQSTPSPEHINQTIHHILDNTALTGQQFFIDSGQQLL